MAGGSGRLRWVDEKVLVLEEMQLQCRRWVFNHGETSILKPIVLNKVRVLARAALVRWFEVGSSKTAEQGDLALLSTSIARAITLAA